LRRERGKEFLKKMNTPDFLPGELVQVYCLDLELQHIPVLHILPDKHKIGI